MFSRMHSACLIPERYCKKIYCRSKRAVTLRYYHLASLSSPRVGPSSDSVRFHNSTGRTEGMKWRPCWFSACSALEGFGLLSQRGILSLTIDLLDGSESVFFCCPAEHWDHGKPVLLTKTHSHSHTGKHQQVNLNLLIIYMLIYMLYWNSKYSCSVKYARLLFKDIANMHFYTGNSPLLPPRTRGVFLFQKAGVVRALGLDGRYCPFLGVARQPGRPEESQRLVVHWQSSAPALGDEAK